MARRAYFDQNMRANLETIDDEIAQEVSVNDGDPLLATAIPPKEEDRNQIAVSRLMEIEKFLSTRKQDDVMKDYGVNPIVLTLLVEMIDKFHKNKLHLSDGNIEMIALQHKKIIRK